MYGKPVKSRLILKCITGVGFGAEAGSVFADCWRLWLWEIKPAEGNLRYIHAIYFNAQLSWTMFRADFTLGVRRALLSHVQQTQYPDSTARQTDLLSYSGIY